MNQTAAQTPSRARNLLAQVLPDRTVHRVGETFYSAKLRWDILRRKRSPFVTGYLKGLKGVEIGAASHNRFYLDAINVDRYGEQDTVYKRLERTVAGKAAHVDIVAPGDELPFDNDSHDFVFSSHVIEHFPDPIKALYEWCRVARIYVVVIAPHRDRTFDVDRPLTPVAALLERNASHFASDEDKHWSVWTRETFVEMCRAAGMVVIDTQDPDDKIGNGFTVVIDAQKG
jgi:SAM-dependent methyltransferase